MSPDAPVELSFRWAAALLALATCRLETVTFADRVILSSACKVRLPAFQLVPPPDRPPLAFAPSLRNKSDAIMIFCGSIRMLPCAPFSDAADRLPPKVQPYRGQKIQQNRHLRWRWHPRCNSRPLCQLGRAFCHNNNRTGISAATRICGDICPAPSVISPSAVRRIEPASLPLSPSACHLAGDNHITQRGQPDPGQYFRPAQQCRKSRRFDKFTTLSIAHNGRNARLNLAGDGQRA